MNDTPWLTLEHPQLKNYIKNAAPCLILIDPQEKNAEYLAKALIAHSLCKQQNACGQCHPCRLRLAQTHPDIILAQNPLDIQETRELLNRLQQTPSISDKRFIFLKNIDNYHENTLNALLKTLEEPSKHNAFILSAHNKRAVKPTILSRAQSHICQRANHEQALNYLLQKGWQKEKAEHFLKLYQNNPYPLAENPNLEDPLSLAPELKIFLFEKKSQALLQRIDQYPENELIAHITLSLEHLIRMLHLDSASKNWQNQNHLHHMHTLHAELSALRGIKQKINQKLQLKHLLLKNYTRNKA